MSHHHHEQGTSETRLFLTMTLNFLITVVEVIGGFYSGSLSLISDALHNLSDGIAIIITYFSLKLSQKPKTLKHTFGLKRAEIIAAIVNASTLIIISVFLIKEASERFYHPSPITGSLMLIVAGIGLAANILGTILLKKGSEDNINIRAAYFHLLSDAASSVAVIFGAACIIYFQIYWIDPLLTVLISLYILKETCGIVKEAVNIIMMSVPAGINLQVVKTRIEEMTNVSNIHHVHVWQLNDNDIHFEAHIEVPNIPVAETSSIQNQIEELLHDEFDVTHTTLQFECGNCEERDLINT